MRQISDLKKLVPLERKRHHHLQHRFHKAYGISKRTLFYMKEYGPHTHVPFTIIKESLKVILLASIISSIGGLSLEYIRTIFLSITPLLILLPALNGLIGSYGTVISSRFSTMLYEDKVHLKWWRSRELRKMFSQVMVIAIITALLSAAIALFVSSFSGFSSGAGVAAKIFIISLVDTVLLVSLLFFVSVFAGIHYFRKQEDPNNFLIPITTSIADFGNIVLLSVLVSIFF